MAPAHPPVRVIVRLPYNRPEDPPPDPPRVEWNAEKEQILLEVIAKSRAIEGAGTDWQGLAAHLQVPLPYLLYRAEIRYEEGLRGLRLQGVRSSTASGVVFPSAQHLVGNPPPGHPTVTNEYFPRIPEVASRRMLGTATPTRPLGVRARLSSLGSQRARLSSMGRQPSQRSVSHAMETSSRMSGALTTPTRPTKKVSSSSTLTLQGMRRSRGSPHRPLSPTFSPAYGAESGDHANGLGDDEHSDESEDEEEARKEEEEDRKAEEQEALERKLKELQLMMTKDALGLVSSTSKDKGKAQMQDRGRAGPLSYSSAYYPGAQQRTSRSQQSLSSMSSRSAQGSIPSIPSSPRNLQVVTNWRSHPDNRASSSANTYEEPLSPPPSSSRLTSPIPRHFSPPDKSGSPPAISTGRAYGQTHVRTLASTSERTDSPGWRMDLGSAGNTQHSALSEQGSQASSFSDLSDASLSASAFESASALMSRGAGGSRLSSLFRSNIAGRRTGR
ncbi:uncharacterized protein LAESUDRAFT_726877 [Laetiporus sulphureus 93-53]|uniref:Autophagy-related protein 29 n=1 Tax=Laetiporus sulphureus 93-53 TaxID=1314785 RepID=A0A165DTB0_9APHY|nr:uncharacterized protein LAESUDRAFT_726877 [Laetiporus sulphureus 93-53]KZT05587.1 hypothetical protein LAESUDRAFT_726877 [Laetiporus sulphureus 93-53]